DGALSPERANACRAVDLPGNSRHASKRSPWTATTCNASTSLRATAITAFLASYQRRTLGFLAMRRAAKNSQRRAFAGPRLLILTRPLYLPLLRSLRFRLSALRYAARLG